MDIIISANEKILSMTKERKLVNDMSEKQFTECLNEIIKAGDDEQNVQEIPF